MLRHGLFVKWFRNLGKLLKKLSEGYCVINPCIGYVNCSSVDNIHKGDVLAFIIPDNVGSCDYPIHGRLVTTWEFADSTFGSLQGA